MDVAWVFVLVGLAVVVWNRRIAGAFVALDRTIAGAIRIPSVRCRVETPWRRAYTRFAVVFVGLMWAGLGVLVLLRYSGIT